MADLEELACLKAVQFTLELGISRVVFEGDSAVVIKSNSVYLVNFSPPFSSFKTNLILN